MRAGVSILAGAAALVLVAEAGAQTPVPAPGRAVTPGENCVTVNGRTECRLFRRSNVDSALMKRAALGIQLTSTGSARDTIGVFVARVTPKGPAENAGIVEGDRIVSINGIDLRVNSADAGDDYASGLPTRRLTREVQKLTPGSAVTLRVYTGGRTRDVRVTTGRAYDLQGRGSPGYFFDGVPGGGMIMDDGPMRSFDRRGLPRTRIRSFPKVQMEGNREFMIDDLERTNSERLRAKVFRLRDGLKDGARFRMLTPSRVRALTDDVLILGPEGELLLDPSESKARKEKEKAEKNEGKK